MAYPEHAVDDGRAVAYTALVERRAAREPVSRILGRREFWSLDFALGEAVLDPRPDTETLVRAALDWLVPRGPSRILDLGTGSGCILLALLHERPEDTGAGIDVSPAALGVARRNAASLGLGGRAVFAAGDWLDAVGDGVADLVVANPPYIAHADLAALEPEVRLFDPAAALDGGGDGLDAYRALSRDLRRVTRPGGAAFLEIGAGQENAVYTLLLKGGAVTVRRHADLAGRVRVLAAEF
ncbi:MAG: peptide chain release factor N(5)-glutamine methyltransferase [Alphaproteobacteria bacterium]|nr:peptide chain release factor N(5)-glutamine methyltransferase [Alphaproteobacteria bacterium]